VRWNLTARDVHLTFLQPRGAIYDMDYEDYEDYRYGLNERQIRDRMNRALRNEDDDSEDIELDFDDLEDEDTDD